MNIIIGYRYMLQSTFNTTKVCYCTSVVQSGIGFVHKDGIKICGVTQCQLFRSQTLFQNFK